MDGDTRELVRQAAEYIVRKEYKVSDIFRKRLYEKDTRFAFLSPKRSHHEEIVRELEETVQRLGAKRKHKTQHTSAKRYRKTTETEDYGDRLSTVSMGTLASYMNRHKERVPYQVLDMEEILHVSSRRYSLQGVTYVVGNTFISRHLVYCKFGVEEQSRSVLCFALNTVLTCGIYLLLKPKKTLQTCILFASSSSIALRRFSKR